MNLFKIPDNFNKAWHQRVVIEESTTEVEEVSTQSKAKKNTTLKGKSKLNAISSDESEVSGKLIFDLFKLFVQL